MDSNAPDSPSPGSARSTPSPGASSPSTGPESSDGMTCAEFNWQTGGDMRLGYGMPTALQRNQTLAVLISSSAASPAKTSAWPASALGSPGPDPGSSGRSSASPRNSARRGGSSRMFQGSFLPMADATSGLSSRGYGNAGLLSATACWTANISESPSGAVACSLSAVLMPEALPRYSLSAKAAAGILRRAAKRGRALPPALNNALLRLSSSAGAELPTK